MNDAVSAYRLIKTEITRAMGGEAMPSFEDPSWADLVGAIDAMAAFGDDAVKAALLGIGMHALGALLNRARISACAEQQLAQLLDSARKPC